MWHQYVITLINLRRCPSDWTFHPQHLHRLNYFCLPIDVQWHTEPPQDSTSTRSPVVRHKQQEGLKNMRLVALLLKTLHMWEKQLINLINLLIFSHYIYHISIHVSWKETRKVYRNAKFRICLYQDYLVKGQFILHLQPILHWNRGARAQK